MKHYECEKYQQQKSNQTDVGSCQYNKFVAILEDLKFLVRNLPIISQK